MASLPECLLSTHYENQLRIIQSGKGNIWRQLTHRTEGSPCGENDHNWLPYLQLHDLKS
jgi:hypothetical protein